MIESPTLTRRVLLRRASATPVAVAAGGLLAPRAMATGMEDIVKAQGQFLVGTASDGIDPAIASRRPGLQTIEFGSDNRGGGVTTECTLGLSPLSRKARFASFAVDRLQLRVRT